MLRQFKIFSAFFFIIIAGLLFGKDLLNNSLYFHSLKDAELRYSMTSIEEKPTEQSNPVNESASVPGIRKPGLGIMMSVAIPGAGQMYAGSWIKGAILLGLEVALWISHGQYIREGQDLEDSYHNYADTHWSEERWRDSIQPDDPATHSLPPIKTQQYYEMIGKYHQFKRGWDDYDEIYDPGLSPRRDYYEGLRYKSNIEFKNASYCAMVVLANHILSAFDAAFTIRSVNRKIEAKIGMDLKMKEDILIPRCQFSLAW
jgi:hypothetical protein